MIQRHGSMDRGCPHTDVRYCADERGAIACFECGRLFGHLREHGWFDAYNPWPSGGPLVSEPGSTGVVLDGS